MSLYDRTHQNESGAEVRMSFGDHIDELRRRVIYALIGLAAAVILCFNFGDWIIETLTTPYSIAMQERGFDPRLVQLNPLEAFMEYFKITLEFGLVLAAPWIIYQIWLFVAAGLYPSERRVVKYFAPASIALFLAGASFMIAVVLSGLMTFLIGISTWMPLPGTDNFLYRWMESHSHHPAVVTTQPVTQPLHVPVLSEDPASPQDGDVWINRSRRRLTSRFDGETYEVPLQRVQAKQFVQPFFSIAEYLSFVVNLALAFGLGFQIPIVVVFLILVRITTSKDMGRARRYVIIGVAIASAIITPTPDVATMLLLAVPMYLLYEIGLIVGRIVERRREREVTAPQQ